ncbi:YCII domain-containing protein [Fusarium keratoplasticum]|nr:YCII domain-containing protein [Fusarium keratoplasticum]
MASSTSAVEKSEWLIHIPDLPDAKERRAAVFPQHIQRMKSDPQDFWVFGGATLKDRASPGQPPHITGSAMLVFAPTRDDVVARLKDDPLVKERVWDLENAQIHPFFRPKRSAI